MFNKALIIGILLVGASFSISANEVQKWEYKCVEIDSEIVEYSTRTLSKLANFEMTPADYIASQIFNGLGEKGWEMVGYGMSDGANARMVCFKRPKKS